MNVDMVFEGGGVLGISFAGAYKALRHYGYTIKRCGGSSAGSVIATLIVAGYTPDDIEKVIKDTDFKRFKKKNKTGQVPIVGKFLSLFFHNGLYESDYIEEWVNILLQNKGINIFGDVMDNGESKLKIIASDITNRKMLVLPDDLVDYGIKPEEFSIAKAVRMSCTIPFFFTPVKLKNEKDNITHLVVDGGLLSNYPIWLFDYNTKCPTIGLKIKDIRSNSYDGKTGFFSYTKDILNTTMNRDESNFIKHENLIRTIIIDHKNEIKSYDFNLNNKQIEYLFNNGYNTTDKYVKDQKFIKNVKINWSYKVRKNI